MNSRPISTILIFLTLGILSCEKKESIGPISEPGECSDLPRGWKYTQDVIPEEISRYIFKQSSEDRIVAISSSGHLVQTDANGRNSSRMIEFPFTVSDYTVATPSNIRIIDDQTAILTSHMRPDRPADNPPSAMVFKTSDGGLTWESQEIIGIACPNLIVFLNTQIGFYGHDELLITRDGGQSWGELGVPLPFDRLFHGNEPSHRIRMWLKDGSRMVMATYTPDTNQFELRPLPDSIGQIYWSTWVGDNFILLRNRNAKTVYVSNDGGLTYEEFNMPEMPVIIDPFPVIATPENWLFLIPEYNIGSHDIAKYRVAATYDGGRTYVSTEIRGDCFSGDFLDSAGEYIDLETKTITKITFDD